MLPRKFIPPGSIMMESNTDETTFTNFINENVATKQYLDDIEMDDSDELQEFFSDDENYACDISLIRINDNDTNNGNELFCNRNVNQEEDHREAFLHEVELGDDEEEQTITELVRASANGSELIEASQSNSMHIVFGIILRLVLPFANGVARSIKGIRDARFLTVLKNIASSRQALTNLVAFTVNTISMNLSAVQVTHRIEPLLKLMKIRKSHDGQESLPDVSALTPTIRPTTHTIPITYSPLIREPNGSLPCFPATAERKMPVSEQTAPKCCTLNVLAEPPAGEPIRADIVFFHGLHGSLVNTWKQGLWENERKPVGFERPPKPPVRPPKRPRHTRSQMMRPPHKQKRARYAHSELFKQSSDRETHDESEELFHMRANNGSNEYAYVCGQPRDIQIREGVEYSFPTFRLRIKDNGRQLRAEIDSILNDVNANENTEIETSSNKRKNNITKPSANDPDYSKCWPGDWLPIDCPGVRVIAVNYTTDQYLWRPLWKPKETRTNLIQRAREMAELLIEQRVGYGHPIVWVGHSKGGLFIKQIIVDAWESGRPAMAPFWRSSRGAFFYSVPHRGSHLASIKVPLLTRSVELIDIEKNSKYLIDLHRRFVGLYHLGHLKIEVFSFVETALTLMSVLYLRIVGVDSADPGIGDVCGIRLDHREICKPRSRECILYKELVKLINKAC